MSDTVFHPPCISTSWIDHNTMVAIYIDRTAPNSVVISGLASMMWNL